MTKEHAQFFANALEYAGEEPQIYEDYSGRGMFGKATCGIVFSHPTILMAAVLDYIAETKISHGDIPSLDKLRQDNIANDFIWY